MYNLPPRLAQCSQHNIRSPQNPVWKSLDCSVDFSKPALKLQELFHCLPCPQKKFTRVPRHGRRQRGVIACNVCCLSHVAWPQRLARTSCSSLRYQLTPSETWACWQWFFLFSSFSSWNLSFLTVWTSIVPLASEIWNGHTKSQRPHYESALLPLPTTWQHIQVTLTDRCTKTM